MNPLLRKTQKYAIPVAIVVLVSVFAAFSHPDDINDKFGKVVGLMASAVFISFPDAVAALWAFFKKVPLVILVLVGGALFFTLRFNFINILGFKHALEVVTGKYDNPDDPGEVSHFQALSSALSATVGLGNIAGVAIAVSTGGPGAIFWMMMTAIFGMTSKFAECTLGQMYRITDARGEVTGGPMVYLRDGLADIGLPNLGKYLSILFAILCIGGSFGGGNMFQANQSREGMAAIIPGLGGEPATGTVRLTADAPQDIQLKKHLARFVRPGLKGEEKAQSEDATAGRTLIYQPTADLKIAKGDWKQSDGKYITDITVKSTKNGNEFNIAAGAIKRFELGTIKGRKLSFAPAKRVSATNPTPLKGGTGHKGGIFGFILAIMVGVVIIGGIQSIGKVAEKIVPLMCGIYLLASMWVIIANISLLPEAIGIILDEAFTPRAGLGGVIGVLIVGVQRAAFSSEAGVGSAAIAHSAAKTDEPIREGIVALLEPFIDTIIVCFMTGMVIVITGVYNDPSTAGLNGVQLTSAAFGSVISWFPIVLSLAVFMFAYSTMISWSYYGERCWTFLFGPGQSMAYRFLFLMFVWLGCIADLGSVTDFSDLMILSMAFPNVIGVVLLSPKIWAELQDYWTRYKNNEFIIYTGAHTTPAPTTEAQDGDLDT